MSSSDFASPGGSTALYDTWTVRSALVSVPVFSPLCVVGCFSLVLAAVFVWLLFWLMLLIWQALAVAWLDWYTPWRAVDNRLGVLPRISAALSMSTAGTPVSSSTSSGVYFSTVALRGSSPTACCET